MQVLERLKIALVLMKDSLLVIKHNPRLTLFPIVSGIAGIVFLAVFLGMTFGALAVTPDDLLGPTLLVGLALVYLGTTFISVFFTAALVHQTRAVLDGAEPSLHSGMAGAWEVRWSLFAWAAISATVGIIINAIEDSNSPVGQALGAIFGIAWTLMTFFIIPAIVFERPSVSGMFKQSASTFRETWGETPVSIVGVGILSFVAALPFAGPGYLLLTSGFVLVGVALIAIGVVFGAILSHTFKGVIKTSLYLYATEGTLPDEFDDVDPDSLARDRTGSPTDSAGATTGGFH